MQLAGVPPLPMHCAACDPDSSNPSLKIQPTNMWLAVVKISVNNNVMSTLCIILSFSAAIPSWCSELISLDGCFLWISSKTA